MNCACKTSGNALALTSNGLGVRRLTRFGAERHPLNLIPVNTGVGKLGSVPAPYRRGETK